MSIWTTELQELGRILESFKGKLPELEKVLEQLIRFDDPNVLMLYSRRSLEVIITDLCESELKRPRKTEPMKGIIDKLNKEEKVPSHIITSMHSLNSLSTYGAHPKDFDPEQVRPVLNNLSIVTKWYLKYKGIEITRTELEEEHHEVVGSLKQTTDVTNLEKSIAILPFRNDSPDEENTYFINGLMEEILNNLQRIKDIRVISRTSVEQYRNQARPVPEIAKELGVNYIVEGSGQKYGNSFRLRTQLIMAAKESHLWGESYQKKINDVEDIFNVQNEVAESIATELKAIITPEEKKLIGKVPTENLEAYDAYLKGNFYSRRLTPKDLDTAMQYYELAKEKDNNNALVYAGISVVWLNRQQMGFTPAEEAGPKAFEAALKSLELDDTLAEVYYSLAAMHIWGMFDWEAGEKAFKKAIELKPAFAEAHSAYSHLLMIMGHQEQALEQIQLAVKQDPLNQLIISFYAMDLVFSRQYEDAIIAAHRALELDDTANVAYNALAISHFFLGNYPETIDAFKTMYTFQYKGVFDNVEKENFKGDVSATMNFIAETLIEYRKESYVLPMDMVQLFLTAGNKERALEWLNTAFEEHDPNLPYIPCWPIFDSIRDEPMLQEILKKMNLA
jgi:TolB-like protein